LSSWIAAAWAYFVGNGPTVPTNTATESARRVILLEGNIGAGKSTLCRVLDQYRRSHEMRTVMEQVGDAFTRLFYTDPARYGFAMQLALHGQRVAALRDAVVSSVGDVTTVLDRSVLGDWAFALWNAALGNMNSDEWAVYLERAGDTPGAALLQTNGATGVAAVLFLSDDPASCHVRVHRRGGVDADAVTLEYLQGLEAAHLLVLNSIQPYRIPVIELHWAEYASTARAGAIAVALHTGLPQTLAPHNVLVDRFMWRNQRFNDALRAVSNARARAFLAAEAKRLGVLVNCNV